MKVLFGGRSGEGVLGRHATPGWPFVVWLFVVWLFVVGRV